MNMRTLTTALAVGLGVLGSLPAAAQAETITIGVIAPLTGAGSTWGIAMAEGARIAAADANARGGLDIGGQKYQVEAIAYDDQYKAAEAVAAYNRLVKQDGVQYLMLLSSASTLAVKQNVEDDMVVALTGAATTKAIDDETRYMFRVFSTANEFLPAYVAWMKDNLTERRVLIVNPNDETGWDQSRHGEELFKANGFEVLGVELYDRAQQDFLPLMTRIISMNPEMIDVSTSPPASVGLIIRQARELGYKGRFVKTHASGPREIVASAGEEAVEGMICLLFVDPSKEEGGYQRIVEEYRKSTGQEPNEILAPYYDGANVLLHAIERSGEPDDTAKVAAAFAEVLPMESIQGEELSFGRQQILTTHYVAMVKDGQPVVLGTIK
jgi:branched-chain amino acid transport system substrate-binding protein